MTDWHDLIHRHLDGRTSPEEAEVLSGRIVDDAEVRGTYLKAAQIHGALADEVLGLDLELEPPANSEPSPVLRQPARPRHVAAGVVTGLFVGLLGAGIAWAFGSPKAETRALNIAHGTFDSLPVGPIQRGLIPRFGAWCGDPLEVVEEADGNRRLRFLETGNVKGNPKGGTTACNAFQFIDLAPLHQQGQEDEPDVQRTLELSVHFERSAPVIDRTYPKVRADCRIYLFDTEPEAIAAGWPHVLTDVVAVGKRQVRLKPGELSGRVLASCLLEPEATVALITLNVGVGVHTITPVELGNYYADDVKLTVTSRPRLPVRVVKLERAD